MPVLADTSLADDERVVVERLVQLMRERCGSRLQSVCSTAPEHVTSERRRTPDIDVLAIAESAEGADDVLTAILLVDRAAEERGVERPIVSVKVRDSAWLKGRRQIELFFVREVDRERVVLHESLHSSLEGVLGPGEGAARGGEEEPPAASRPHVRCSFSCHDLVDPGEAGAGGSAIDRPRVER